MQLIEIHNRWTQKLHILRFFDEEEREGEERDKWIPERMPEGFGIGKNGKQIVEQEQGDTRTMGSVGGECAVSPFLQDFLTRKL